MSFTPNYKPIINNISSDLSVDNDYVYSINNKDKNKIYLSAVENNTTLNNITEYFCVFRTSEDNVIHKAGYTTNLSGNLISGSFLSAKLVEKYPDFYEEIDGEKYYILPEHWSVPDIKNTDIIPCLTHNKYFPLSDEYNKLSVITTIQEKCIGHLLIPLSSDISIDINTILYKQIYPVSYKEVNQLIEYFNKQLAKKIASNKYNKVFRKTIGYLGLQQILPVSTNLVKYKENQSTMHYAIIKQLKQLNYLIGKLQTDDSYNDMHMYDQFPNNNIEETEDNRKIRTEIIDELKLAISCDMSDCICYSDCNGYSVCWCYGNCNHY